jgi:hypothetical protein
MAARGAARQARLRQAPVSLALRCVLKAASPCPQLVGADIRA